MKLTRPQTYKVISFVLEKRAFKQLEAQKAVGVSFGLVNRVTKWMVSRGFAARREGKYAVVAPAALTQVFSLFRRMEELRVASLMLDVEPREAVKLLAGRGGVLCLTTALAFYDDYVRDPAVHAYAGPEAIEKLREFGEGRTRIDVYADDLKQPQDFIEVKGARITGKVRTIIDLLCSERAYAAEKIIKKTWG